MGKRTNDLADGGALVTVALAVLNGGEALQHAVRSIINQSWPHWELLLLDDGSTDEAIDRLPFLADPRIVVIRDGQNLGLASRLNEASVWPGKVSGTYGS